jgi:O-antigen/teichoic acid export membrane protein
MKFLKRDFLINFILFSFSTAFLKVVGLVVFFYLGSQLSSSDYASFGILYSLQVLVNTFGIAGVVEFFVSRVHHTNNEDVKRELESVVATLLLILLTITCLFISIYFVIRYEPGIDLFLSFLFVLINSVVLTISSFRTQIERLYGNYKDSLKFSFVVPLSSFIIGFVLFNMEHSVNSFFLGCALGSILSLLFLGGLNFNLSLSSYGLVWIAGLSCLPHIGSGFFGWVGGYGINHIITSELNVSVISTFSFLYPVGSLMQLFASSMNQAWSPVFFREIHSDFSSSLEIKNKRFFKLMIFFLTLIGVIMVIFVPKLVRFFGGNIVAYVENEFYLFAIVLSYVVLPPFWHCQNYFLAYGLGGDLFNVGALSTGLGILFTVLFIRYFGEVGVYLGILSTSIIKVVIIYIVSIRHWKLNVSFDFLFACLFCLSIFYICWYFLF